MPPLHRHQLARPSAAGWRAVLESEWDDAARDCLRHWARHDLPLVVTRQRAPRTSARAPVAFGLSAPEIWQRRLLAVELPPQRIGWFDEFPLLDAAIPTAPRTTRAALCALARRLGALGVRARAYGSIGWQSISGLRYAHDLSDLDLWLAVDDAQQADAAAQALDGCDAGALRIDGELMFGNGDAVAWREWIAWRAGRCRSLLVKRLDGVQLHEGAPPPQRPAELAPRLCAA